MLSDQQKSMQNLYLQTVRRQFKLALVEATIWHFTNSKPLLESTINQVTDAHILLQALMG